MSGTFVLSTERWTFNGGYASSQEPAGTTDSLRSNAINWQGYQTYRISFTNLAFDDKLDTSHPDWGEQEGFQAVVSIGGTEVAPPIEKIPVVYDDDPWFNRWVAQPDAYYEFRVPADVAEEALTVTFDYVAWPDASLGPDVRDNSAFTVTQVGNVEKFTWDFRNRLTRVERFENQSGGTQTLAYSGDPSVQIHTGDDGNGNPAPVSTIDYVYDVLGQIIERHEQGTAPSYYLHERGQRVLELEEDGTTDHRVAMRQLWSTAVDRILAMEDIDYSKPEIDVDVVWPLTDHQGTIRNTIQPNASGADLIVHLTCDRFGNPKDLGGFNHEFAPLYAGRELDTKTGLYFNRARWYDPTSARFLSEDPLSFAAGDTNLYRYCANSPTHATDPTGQFAISGTVAAALIIGTGLEWVGREWVEHSIAHYDAMAELNATAGWTQAEFTQYSEHARAAEFYHGWGETIGMSGILVAAAPLAGPLYAMGSGTMAAGGFGPGAQAVGGMVFAGATEKVAADTLLYTTGLDDDAFARYLTHPGQTAFGFAACTLGAGLGNATALTRTLATSTRGTLTHAAYRTLLKSGAAGRIFPKGFAPTGQGRWIRNPRSGGSYWVSTGTGRGGRTLYWHGSAEAVADAARNGLFAHGPGAGSKYWAVTRGESGFLTEMLIGGNRNIDSLVPWRTSLKGGFGSVYTLTAKEASQFSRAWGFRYSWNPYQWYKGGIGQYYFHPGAVSWGQRGVELGRAGSITSIIVGGTWAGPEAIDWWNEQ